ncbi:DUF2867 domain-containing protein [Ktedonosporobacter rubrisoli]|nr:DUF2867 domain-containing protein [Ktedonosporobacter rubrisoli]
MQTNSTHPTLNFPEIEPLLCDADYIDVASAIGKGDLRTFVAGWITYQPAWMKPVLILRTIMLGRESSKKNGKGTSLTPQTVPMQAGEQLSGWTVRQAEEDSYLIVEMHAKNQEAALSFVAEPLANQQKRFAVLLALHYVNQSGRRSFQILQPFHRLLDIVKTKAGMRACGEVMPQVHYWRWR